MKRLKRYFLNFRLLLCKNNSIEKIIKKHKVFKLYGDNNHFCTRRIPSDPELIKIHNNVCIASNVTFVTHDIIHYVFNNHKHLNLTYFQNEIEIFDNVMIGTNSTILYGVKIGPNAIVAAGSVVTKNVDEGTIVGGNPAKVIGRYNDLLEKRIAISKNL